MGRETINEQDQKLRQKGDTVCVCVSEGADKDKTKRRGEKKEVPFMLFILVLFQRAPCYLGKLP